jgi:cyclophilin family peptidyl-prolyl cis-trans isomerase
MYRYKLMLTASITTVLSLVATLFFVADAFSQEPATEAATAEASSGNQSNQPSPAAGEQANAASLAANAAFQAKFKEYRAALRDIEKLRAEYQTADETTRTKINEQLSGQVAHAQSLINAMIEAATEAYRLAPNSDPEIAKFLIAVARYYAIGRQAGPGVPSPGNPDDLYYPIDGGDQYERALPLIKLLVDHGADDKLLLVWGFLAAFMTNDYELAKQYLAKANESGGLEELGKLAQKDDNELPDAGLMKMAAHLVSSLASVYDQYADLWAKESAIRTEEAKADDLPRVKFTTSKGEITIELFENQAPQSVANFLSLVKQGFYDGSPFHRVLPEFMAQGGAKDDQGQGGPGYTIRCECYRPDYRRHFRGTLSMAHAGRDTGNSQFFLTFVPTPHLNGRHTAFGRVIEGIEVLGDLQHRSPQHQDNMPPADKILKAEVIRDRGHEYSFDKLPDR